MKINEASMDRFLRSIEGLPNATSAPASDGRDAPALARELYSQFDLDLKEYEKTRFPDRKLADGESVTVEDIVEADMARPPDRVNFATLRLLAAHRPESKWEEVVRMLIVPRLPVTTTGSALAKRADDPQPAAAVPESPEDPT